MGLTEVMNINSGLYKFAPFHVWKTLRARVEVKLGGKSLYVPLEGIGSITSLNWKPSWKTNVLSNLLPTSEGVFIDVGANTGQTLMDFYAAGVNKPYIGFEPNPSCAAYLAELIDLNHLSNYIIVASALGDKASVLKLYLNDYSRIDTAATVIEGLRPNRSYNERAIPCISFDKVWNDFGYEEIGFIKIDVEGAELNVLNGMRSILSQYRSIVLCEVLFTAKEANIEFMSKRNKELSDLLKGLNYKIFLINKDLDEQKVLSLESITEFPSGYYSELNKHLCDYLFVPEERADNVLKRLME